MKLILVFCGKDSIVMLCNVFIFSQWKSVYATNKKEEWIKIGFSLKVLTVFRPDRREWGSYNWLFNILISATQITILQMKPEILCTYLWVVYTRNHRRSELLLYSRTVIVCFECISADVYMSEATIRFMEQIDIVTSTNCCRVNCT